MFIFMSGCEILQTEVLFIYLLCMTPLVEIPSCSLEKCKKRISWFSNLTEVDLAKLCPVNSCAYEPCVTRLGHMTGAALLLPSCFLSSWVRLLDKKTRIY